MEASAYLEKLLIYKGINISGVNKRIFETFIQNKTNQDAVKQIVDCQNIIMKNWDIINNIEAIQVLQIPIPNATNGKKYEVAIDYEKLGLDQLVFIEWQGLEDIGLAFNALTQTIEGTPTQSGDLSFKLLFKVAGQAEEDPVNEKKIPLIVNADPKTLWKDIPSEKEALFWKKDDIKITEPLGEKHIVVASNRGRSHENVGSFRDDDFAFKHLTNIGWSVVAVSDGAGSYSLSREGARVACESIVDYFENNLETTKFDEFEQKILEYGNTKDENTFKEIEGLSKQNLYKAVLFAHNKIKDTATQTQLEHPELFTNTKAKSIMDYFHATLIFTLYKKFEFGYVIMTFGVGDCPIAIMNKEQTETTLMNWLDVGEFGGGTRFVSQPEIFHSNEHPMASRFNIKIIPDFSYLFLMSDGIYDPKFVVEANLEKHEKWVEFLKDLQGENDDNAKVEFSPENDKIADQLSTWMDFWNPGNHDDRTLAIIF